MIFVSACIDSYEAQDDSVLSEFQMTACDSADKGGTCDTKLEALGLVTKEECCNILGKCCS